MQKAIMVDLETLSTQSNAVIVSIGAVAFYPSAEGIDDAPEDSFYTVVDISSCLAEGLHIRGDTLKWWLDQDVKARKVFSDPNTVHIASALVSFNHWFRNFNIPNMNVWSHGPSFDIAILETAFRKTNSPISWVYNAPRDTRTIYELAGIDIKKEPREGTFHNALDDAKFQACLVQKAYRKLFQLATS